MIEILTKEQIDEAKKLCAAATEGPWAHYGIGGVDSPDFDVVWEGHGSCQECGADLTYQPIAQYSDAEFIARSRTLLPQALSTALHYMELCDRLAVMGWLEPRIGGSSTEEQCRWCSEPANWNGTDVGWICDHAEGCPYAEYLRLRGEQP